MFGGERRALSAETVCAGIDNPATFRSVPPILLCWFYVSLQKD
jgi:hypothetical protein